MDVVSLGEPLNGLQDAGIAATKRFGSRTKVECSAYSIVDCGGSLVRVKKLYEKAVG